MHRVEGVRQLRELVAPGPHHGLVLPSPCDELARCAVEGQDALAHRGRRDADGDDPAQPECTEGDRQDQAVFIEHRAGTDIAVRDRSDQRHVVERFEPDQADRVRIVTGIGGAPPGIDRTRGIVEPLVIAGRGVGAQLREGAACGAYAGQRDLDLGRIRQAPRQARVHRQLEDAGRIRAGHADHLDPGRPLSVEDETRRPPGIARGDEQRLESRRLPEVHAFALLHDGATLCGQDPAARSARGMDGALEPLGRYRRARRLHCALQERVRHGEVAQRPGPLASQAGFRRLAPLLPDGGPRRLEGEVRQQEGDDRHRGREDGDQRHKASTQGHLGTGPPQAGRALVRRRPWTYRRMMRLPPAANGRQRTDGGCRSTGGARHGPPVDRR